MTDGAARTIPFTRAQRSTIRVTGLVMLPTALLSLWSGTTDLLEVLPVLQVIQPWPLVVMALSSAAEAVLGLSLLIGGVVFLGVASQGTIGALVRGLRALLVVFCIKAALLLLVLAALVFAFGGAPLIF